MKITAKIRDENRSLANWLKAQGIYAQRVRNAVIVELFQDGSIFHIPDEITHLNPVFQIELEEIGGGKTKTGEATIVCSQEGNRLRPYCILRKGRLACGEHALFAIVGGVVTIKAERQSQEIEICEHQLVREGYTIQISTRKIWSGISSELPEQYIKFSEAVQAAVEKTQCFHCEAPHYVSL